MQELEFEVRIFLYINIVVRFYSFILITIN